MLEHGRAIDELTKRVEALEAKLAELTEPVVSIDDVTAATADSLAILCRGKRCPLKDFPHLKMNGIRADGICPVGIKCNSVTPGEWVTALSRIRQA